MELEEFIDIALNQYIEQDIIRLDVSDTTKNRLKRDLRKIFKDEDLIHDIKEESISRAIVEEQIGKINELLPDIDYHDIKDKQEREHYKKEFMKYITVRNYLQGLLNKGE